MGSDEPVGLKHTGSRMEAEKRAGMMEAKKRIFMELEKRATTPLDEAPEEPLPDWVFSRLKEGEKAYLIRAPEGLIVVCVSDDPARNGRNLWVLD